MNTAVMLIVMMFGGVPTSTHMEFSSIQACIRMEQSIHHDFHAKGMDKALVYTNCHRG